MFLNHTLDDWIGFVADPRDICEAPPKSYVAVFLNIVSMVSLFVYSAVYVVLFGNAKKLNKPYRIRMFLYVSINIMTDLGVTFIIRPVFYVSYLAARPTGLWPLRHTAGALSIGLVYLGSVINAFSIADLFAYRLKSIIQPWSRFNSWIWVKMIRAVDYTFLGLFVIATISFFMEWEDILNQTKMKEDSGMVEEHPETACISTIMLPPTTIPMAVLTVCTAAFYPIVTISIILPFRATLLALKILSSLSSISKHTEKVHRDILLSLLAQTIVHVSLLISPSFIYVIAVVLKTSIEEIGDIGMLIFGCHGPIFASCMLVLSKPFGKIKEKPLKTLAVLESKYDA